MNADPAILPPDRLAAAQPCAESCLAFRPLHPDRWSEYGRCANPRARFHGYPVHLGRLCRHFVSSGLPAAYGQPAG